MADCPVRQAGPAGGYGVVQDKSLWWRCSMFPRLGNIRLNPVVYIISLFVIISFAAWAMLQPTAAKEEFGAWKV